ncbi:putative retrotransposon gag domain-containing protein [Helianthus anomalus]
MTAFRQMSSEEREDLIRGQKSMEKGKEKDNLGDDGLDQPYLPRDLAEVSKFTRRIAEAPMPPKTKLPSGFDRYDGTRDPEDHLHAFRGAGQLGRWPMPVWCHMFVQTLTEGARLWFDSLPPGGIDSYEELSEKFLRNFGQQRKVVKNPNEILHIRQRDNERIDQYMERFVKESMNINGVPEVMKINSFINGLKHAQLCEKLGEEFPHSFDNLMDRVRAYVRGKDTVNKANETDVTPRRVTPTTKPPDKGTPYSRKPAFDRMMHDRVRPSYSPYRPRGRGPTLYPDNFTPLTKTPSEILATERVKNSFPRPPPIIPGSKAQPNEYCDFHKGFGHKTDDCMYLKREIETAVKTGRLAHLVKEIKEGGGGTVREEM